jgi:hypothetical protein
MMIARLPRLAPFLSASSLVRFSFAKEVIPRRFRNRQKTRPPLLTLEDRSFVYNPVQALHLMRLHAFTTFEESVEICVRLNVNPKNGEQIVRGTANLPAGLGKSISTAVLCSDDEWEELQAADVQVDQRLKEADLKQVYFGLCSLKRGLFPSKSSLPRRRTSKN